MQTLLKINSSIFSDAGKSSRLADYFVAAWRDANPGGVVIERDLARDPVPHLDAGRFGAFIAPPAQRSAQQIAAIEYSDALIAELERADVVVLGLPLYNFGVPSALKAYFDHIARAGVTFRYGADGPIGLLTGKEVHVLAARGGLYAGSARDSQTTFVRDFLGFLGMTDVRFIYAEGLALGDETARASIARALDQVDFLFDVRAAAE